MQFLSASFAKSFSILEQSITRIKCTIIETLEMKSTFSQIKDVFWPITDEIDLRCYSALRYLILYLCTLRRDGHVMDIGSMKIQVQTTQWPT